MRSRLSANRYPHFSCVVRYPERRAGGAISKRLVENNRLGEQSPERTPVSERIEKISIKSVSRLLRSVTRRSSLYLGNRGIHNPVLDTRKNLILPWH